MLLALGAAASVLDAFQSLTAPKSSSSKAQGQAATNGFDSTGSIAPAAGAASFPLVSGGSASISPQTMSALISAQSQSGSDFVPASRSSALQDLFSRIDANGDGSITKTEFEDALGAGGTNIAAADDVFGKLDTSGEGAVDLGELRSALQGRHHGHHPMQAPGTGDAAEGDASSDPLMQVLSGASSTSVTNSDGSTTTSITYADGSKVTMTSAPAVTASSAAGSATSSYNLIERLIQREAQALSASAAASLSVSA